MLALKQESALANRITFRASDVPLGDVARSRQDLVLVPFEKGMEHRCGPDIEVISATCPFLLKKFDSQPLLAATHIAFSFHLPLVLTPDAIWATLLKGVSIHINQNSEKLRASLVQFEGKETIEVRRDDFRLGDPKLPWPEVIAEFSEKVRNKAPKATELFDASFSTTGLAESTAFRVAMMDSLQKYFRLQLSTLCGIPQISLEGDPADWQQINDKIAAFRAIGLDGWVDNLESIMGEFMSASKGNADSRFWDNIYKYHPPKGSGNFYTTGWIRDLFPYLMPNYGSDEYRVNPYVGKRSEKGPTINQFPESPARAPFTWKYFDQELDMEVVAGLMGVSFKEETPEVRPEFGWAVRHATPEQRLGSDN